MRTSAPPSSSRHRTQSPAKTQAVQSTKPVNLPGYQRRSMLVGGLLGLGLIGLVVRLVWLQIYAAPNLQARAVAQRAVQLSPKVALHPIVDRSGNVLAQDEPLFRLFAHPIIYRDNAEQHQKIVDRLAPLLKMPPAELDKLLRSGESGIPIANDLPEELATQIRELGLDGLELTQEWQRQYPQSDLTAGIVGYVDAEHIGQAGIEYSLRSLLTVKPSTGLVSKDGTGWLLPDGFAQRPLNADESTLRLTIDTRLQRSARMAIQKQIKAFNALKGTLIVMDVQDGSILALASQPTFKPEKFYESNPSLFRNWAITDLYEPGSTFKPINVAIALSEKVIEPNTVVYDEGNISVGGWPIQNNDGTGNGPINITRVLEVSSNVAMVHIMERLNRTKYYEHLNDIGIGSVTGTDLPFETPGQLKDKQQFVDYIIESATAAFGQGFSVTPLQMAQLHAAIANGGMLVTPHVTDGLYDTNNRLLTQPDLMKPRRVFTQAAADRVRQMMGSVVQNGTGQPAKIPGYRLGGKTGTAQKADNGAYINARITSFVALFPLDKPKYVVIAVVDEPKGANAFGSTTAAPAVKSVIETLISVEGIPPSHPEELKPNQNQGAIRPTPD